jgi:hypothetical protein
MRSYYNVVILVVRIQRHKHEALIFKDSDFSVEIRSLTFLIVKDFCIIKNNVKSATPCLHVTQSFDYERT